MAFCLETISGDLALLEPVLRDNGKLVEVAAKNVQDFGLSLSQVDAARIDEADKSMRRLSLIIEGVKNQLAAAAAPFIDVISDSLGDAAREGVNLREVFTDLFKGIVRVGFEIDELRRRWLGSEEDDATRGIRKEIDNLEASVVSLRKANASFSSNWQRVIDSNNRLIVAAQERIGNLRKELETAFSDTDHRTAEERYKAFLLRLEVAEEKFAESVAKRQREVAARETRATGAGAGSFVLDEKLKQKRRELELVLAEVQGGAKREEKVLEQTRDARLMLLADVAKRSPEIKRRQANIELQIQLDYINQSLELSKQQAEKVREQYVAVREFEISLQDQRDQDISREADRYDMRSRQLAEFLQNKLVTEEEHRQLTEQLEEQHLKRLRDIHIKNRTDLQKFTAKSSLEQTQTVLGALNAQIGGIQTSNKKIFAIQKALAISETIINTYAGAARALKDYPAPISYAVAAATAAFGFARVSAIASSQLGGGRGGGGGGGAGIPTAGNSRFGDNDVPINQRENNRIDVTIALDQESLLSGRQVASLIEQINEQIGDGAQLGSIRVT